MKKKDCLCRGGKNSPVLKILRVMKLTAIILFSTTMLVSAGLYSQTTRLTLNFSDISYGDLFQKIEEQSEFSFAFTGSNFDSAQKIEINVTQGTVEEILNEVLPDNVTYEIINRYVVIRNADEKNATESQQTKTISGKVTDSSSAPLPGVTVVVKGTTIGIITDVDGYYSLANVSSDAILVFSFVGMKTQEIPLDGKTVVDAVMTEDAIGIEEVVAIGYGTAKKATVTGSITTVKGEQLETSPSINFSNSLAGRLPGLIAINSSGEPGDDGATLRIRGLNTLNDNSPLIVVDGIPNRDLERLNSSDIESITVLKDASAAIYGSQAANGVILITTKRGEIGKPRITATVTQGWSTPTVIPEMADAATYAEVVNQINGYDGSDPTYSDEDIQLFKNGSDPWGHPDTDWFDDVYKNYSSQNNVNMSISGGTENVKYFISLGYKYQDGNYHNSGTNYNQYDFRSNIDGKVSDHIRVSFDVFGRQEERLYPTKSAGTIFNSTLRSYPTMPAYWPNGLPGPDIERGENPVVMATDATGYDKDKRYIFGSKLNLNVDIPWIKGLSVSANASVDKNILNDKLWCTPWTLYTWDGLSYDENGEPELVGGSRGYSEPRLTQTMEDEQQIMLNVLVNYEHTIADKHNIGILVGSERITGNEMTFWAYRRYYISDEVQELYVGGEDEKDNSGSSDESARLNYFGRVNYNFSQKYMAEFVWRYDGSYIFPTDSRFGFFPGFSLGWRISEEKFWKNNIPYINYFKIRGAWGQTGNDRVGGYQYLSSYEFDTNYIFNTDTEVKTLSESVVANPDITWEVADQSNIGFDAMLFNDRLSLTFDYFHNLRKNILCYRNASVPASTGLELPQENIGKVANNGFEFVIGYNNKIGEVGYHISVNGAHQKNKIKFWDETPGAPDYQKSTGRPINARLLYHAIGIFADQAAVDAYPHWDGAQPGDIIFEDVSGDGEIDGDDKVRYDKTEMPTFTGGLNIDLAYKNFYANIFFQGAAGAVITHTTESGLFGNFRADDVIGRWTSDNPNASKPRPWNSSDQYWYTDGGNNTYFNMDNDYIRLKNLEIGYNMPSRFNDKLKIDGLKFFFNGANLFTITKMKDFDPEASSGHSYYPLVKVYNFGITLTL